MADCGHCIEAVEKFFAINQTVGLELPDGWFGRPFDNQYRFVALGRSDGALIIEFGYARTLLVFDGETQIAGDSSLLVLSGFDFLEFESSAYGTDEVYLKRYEGGEVKIHAMARWDISEND